MTQTILDINTQRFPTTRYQGSKKKLLPWIYNTLCNLEFETVLDGFGGTGAVSYLLKSMGKEVVYNDYLKFNSIIAKSLIENSDTTLTEEDVWEYLSSKKVENGIVSKLFKDVYFLHEENQWIDSVFTQLNNLRIDNVSELTFKNSIALNAIFQSCLIKRPFNLFHRKNLYIRTNDVKRNFGNKTSWDRSFDVYFKRFVAEINQAVFNSGKSCSVLNEDIFNIEAEQFDLVYLDPPYVKNNVKKESTNYLNYYHFLEGLSNYDEWVKQIDFDSKTLKINNSYLPNHFISSNVEQTFEKLIHKFQRSIIVISYKYGGIPSIDDIVKILERFGKKVYTESVHYKYALNKQNGNAVLNREFLIIGK